MSYLDVWTQFHLNGCLFHFHLMAIPLFEQHTGENIFVVLKKLLDAVFNPMWRLKWISVSSNGARNMTGCTNSLVTCISYHCDSGIILIWCGLHQLDFVMQRIFKPAFDGRFYLTLMSLIGYLWCQQHLINVMWSTCPSCWYTVDLHAFHHKMACTTLFACHRIFKW